METKASNCLTREKKKLIFANHGEGKSSSGSAAIVRRSKSVVIRRFKADNKLEPKPGTGKPPMTTKREDRMIVKMSLRDLCDTTFLVHFVSKQKIQLFRKTVSGRLNKKKIRGSDSMLQTFAFIEKSKGSSWLRHRTYPVDRGIMEYDSI